jgi:hypothetical protein
MKPYELADLRAQQPQRGDRPHHGDAPRVRRAPVDYKRSSARGPLAPAPMTSAHCGGRWPRSGALSQMTGVGSPPGRGSGHRSLITKKEGVEDK